MIELNYKIPMSTSDDSKYYETLALYTKNNTKTVCKKRFFFKCLTNPHNIQVPLSGETMSLLY